MDHHGTKRTTEKAKQHRTMAMPATVLRRRPWVVSKQNAIGMNDCTQGASERASIKEHPRGMLSCICQEQGLGKRQARGPQSLSTAEPQDFLCSGRHLTFLILAKYLSLSELQTPCL